MKYRVTLSRTEYKVVEVEADDSDDAGDRAAEGEGRTIEDWEGFGPADPIEVEPAE